MGITIYIWVGGMGYIGYPYSNILPFILLVRLYRVGYYKGWVFPYIT